MTWVNLLKNPESITSIFTDIPFLCDVRVHEIQLHQDGPSIVIRIDLNSYPTSPPRKWAAGQCNRVQITLFLFSVTAVELHGWGNDNVGNVEMSREDGQIRVRFTAATTELDARVGFVSVSKISAYCDGTLSNPALLE